MPGATQDVNRTIPRFDHADDTAVRDHFITAAVQNIARAKRNLAGLQKAATAVADSARPPLQAEIDQLQRDVDVAEGMLGELQNAGVVAVEGLSSRAERRGGQAAQRAGEQHPRLSLLSPAARAPAAPPDRCNWQVTWSAAGPFHPRAVPACRRSPASARVSSAGRG